MPKPGGGRHKVYVHRWVWEQVNGPIPTGMIIMHRCDNPACFRLDHLSLGTHKENEADKYRKGRQNTVRGERNGRTRLTETQAREIIAVINNPNRKRGELAALGPSMGIKSHLVWMIVTGKSWSHLSGIPDPRKADG